MGGEYADFRRAMKEPPSTGVRLRQTPAGWFDAYLPQQVPWHPDGRILGRRPDFTLDPLFHAGGYYVQEPSSMIVYRAAAGVLGSDSRVLDMCASPGGKSTLLSALGPAVVVANEPIASRVAALQENMAKFGGINWVVTRADPEAFGQAYFDFVLVDAPCSGEGLWRKMPEAEREWSMHRVATCASRQARILSAAYRALKPGGRLVYTTCTFAFEENETNAAGFSKNHPDMVPVEFDFPESWGVEELAEGYALLPHRCVGEGFYLAAWDKDDGPCPRISGRLPQEGRPRMETPGRWYDYGGTWRVAEPEAARTASVMPGVRAVGVAAGKDGRKGFVPAHEAAYLPGDGLELDRLAALRYLKGEVPLPPPEHPGQILRLTYQGLGLGWAKAAGPDRWNSSLPPVLRIRKSIDGPTSAPAKAEE